MFCTTKGTQTKFNWPPTCILAAAMSKKPKCQIYRVDPVLVIALLLLLLFIKMLFLPFLCSFENGWPLVRAGLEKFAHHFVEFLQAGSKSKPEACQTE